MKIFITGIAGFIGSTVARELLRAGHEVSGCDDLSMGKPENVPAGIRWKQADVRDLDFIPADAVAHLAAMACARWPDDQEIWDRNLVATAHLRQIFKGRVVFASTCVAARPALGAYAASKWACEQILPHATRLRFANVYGSGQRDWGPEPGVLAAWKKAAEAGEPLRIDGDGSQTRDFIHVDDVARAVKMACEFDGGDGETLDICTGVQTPIADLTSWWPDSPVVYAPRNPVDPEAMLQDPGPAERVLGFKAEVAI